MIRQRRLGLIGDPVAHSMSPIMHRAGFSALGIEAVYELCPVTADHPEMVEAEMRRLAVTGGGNITVPHKASAARALDRPSETVTALGACNCFWEVEPGILAGDNTDVFGIRETIGNRLTTRRLERVLILGAGGAAAAAGLAMRNMGASEVLILNRTLERAHRLVERLEVAGVPASVMEEAPSGEYDLVINATSLGLNETDPLPLDFDRVSPTLILDLVYGQRQTAWTRVADAVGVDWIDGREVLLQQGAACYPLWFGMEGPVEAMRCALFGEDD